MKRERVENDALYRVTDGLAAHWPTKNGRREEEEGSRYIQREKEKKTFEGKKNGVMEREDFFQNQKRSILL